MEPRISLITLGVSDLARARRFYERGLGWAASQASGEGVAFYPLAGGIALALFARDALAADAADAADAGVAPGTAGAFGGVTLAHNVRSRDEVDAVLSAAVAAGATLLQPGREPPWGGWSGYFADPDGHAWEVAWQPSFELDENGALRVP